VVAGGVLRVGGRPRGRSAGSVLGSVLADASAGALVMAMPAMALVSSARSVKTPAAVVAINARVKKYRFIYVLD
jgi:hypothetical protein